MRTETIPLDETDCFSQFFIDYISGKPELAPFYTAFPSLENFAETIKNRNFSGEKREVLTAVLQAQYQDVDVSSSASENLHLLADKNTFTITTGHQLNIFTGPLYFVYKIVTVINACKALKKAYPEYNFVPIYWMASEDHDFEEISHFLFEGKKHEWNTEQIGAVGHFDPAGLLVLASQLPNGADFFKEAYSKQTLADAVRHYVNHLFSEEGLLIIDADDPKLKALFRHVIKDDLKVHSPATAATKTTQKLEEMGYKTQVNAREINFFYLEKGLRERIEKTADGYKVLNTDLTFSESEMDDLIEQHPERFSPNVILRPLYQETILPNLAYVGGPSEAIYWLQLKDVFESFNTPFPLLMPRNFALVIPKSASLKWNKTGLSSADLFLSTETAFSKWTKSNTANDLSLAEELTLLEDLGKKAMKKAASIDPTLVQHMEALHASFQSKIEKAEKKLLRAEKRKNQDRKRQIEEVQEMLCPGGGLQERKVNFLNFYLQDKTFIQSLLSSFDAFDYKMYLLYQ